MNTEIFELRVYPEPSDAYEKDGKYIRLPFTHTLKECEEIIERLADVNAGEIVAVSHTDGKRYFAPRDGFDWMDVTKTEEV
jgi:hypothetical protein